MPRSARLTRPLAEFQRPHRVNDHVTLPKALRAQRFGLRLLHRLAPDLGARLTTSLFTRVRRRRIDYKGYLPTGGQRIEIFHNLSKLSGYRWGETGPVVVLVHGWESHLGRMLAFVSPLLEAGFQVVAFDAPSHGVSPRRATHLLDFSLAVQNALEQFDPVYGVIAHSLGAAASVLTLAREPELAVERLVLLAPMDHLEQHLEVFTSAAALTPAMERRLRQRLEQHLGQPIAACDVQAAARSLHMPGLVIHDRHDTLIHPVSGYSIAQNWRQGSYMETTDLGHKQILRDPAVVRQVVNFMRAGTLDVAVATHAAKQLLQPVHELPTIVTAN